MSERPNVFEPDCEDHEREGFTYRRARLGRQAGAARLGASLYELPPGQSTFPYHWHSANEEMLIVLSGRVSLRTPAGWRELEPGELVSFAAGPEGAHQMSNGGSEPARLLVISEMNAPELSVYPDSGKIASFSRAPGAADTPDEIALFFRRADAVDYWDGEEPPSSSSTA